MKQRLRRLAVAGAIAVLAVTSTALPQPNSAAASITTSTEVHRDLSGKQHDRSRPNAGKARLQDEALTFPAECPPTITCIVKPAAYAGNDPADKTNYGNLDIANRPRGMAITQLFVHSTEGSLESTLNAFQNPAFYASSHYVVDRDGTVYQMVQTKDIAWHAGNWDANVHSIGIEHVGRAALGHVDFTPQMYHASAELASYLSQRFGIPRDRQHILGHDNVPGPNTGQLSEAHVDPGPFWNWETYLHQIGGALPAANPNGGLVTIAPRYHLNLQQVSGCWPNESVCTAGFNKSNFVYLRSGPSRTSPLISDPTLGPGSTHLSNNNARAFYGQSFASCGQQVIAQGTWHCLWYGEQQGWAFSSNILPSLYRSSGQVASIQPGFDPVPIYGQSVPEESDYRLPNYTPPAQLVLTPDEVILPYRLRAGQQYSTIGGLVRANYFYAWTFDLSLPYDHTVFLGSSDAHAAYTKVQWNSRLGYVRARDVVKS